MLNTLLPYTKILYKCSSGKTETSEPIISDILLRRIVRWAKKRGQRRKKWTEVSSSIPQEQVGLTQLKLWLNLWSRRSENVTRIFVRSFIPHLSRNPYTGLPKGRMKSLRYFLKPWTEDLHFASSLNSFHCLIVYGIKLYSCLSVLVKRVTSRLLRKVTLITFLLGRCAVKYDGASPSS